MKFSVAFGLNKTQAELDFVDIPLDTDIPLFIDPCAFREESGDWFADCVQNLTTFFECIIESIADGDDEIARRLLNSLAEPNETHFGLSQGPSKGRGVGGLQATQLFNSLKQSEAVKSRLLSDLAELELMVEGVGHDKISDITTNIIRVNLIEYTQQQCLLHGIPMQQVASGRLWNKDGKEWTQKYCQLPVWQGCKVILIPKMVARFNMAISHQEYYQHFILNFLQQEGIDSGSSLIKLLRDGTPKIYKKDLKEQHPLSKNFIFEFTKNHPEVLELYRRDLKHACPVKDEELHEIFREDFDERVFASALLRRLQEIPKGPKSASDYHNFMIGVLQFIFFPMLTHPKKEREVHDGRKRIDISYVNSARSGFFFRALTHPGIRASEICVECKNYTGDLENPELDQISSRFNPMRGRLGILVGRSCANKKLFMERCRDTARDDRGVVLPLFDDDLLEMLELIKKEERDGINELMEAKFRIITS